MPGPKLSCWWCVLVALLLPGALRLPAESPAPAPEKALDRETAAAIKAARAALRRALQSADTDAVEEAGDQLASAGGRVSMRLLLDTIAKVPPSEDSIYWSLMGAAVSFVDRPAIEELGKFLVREKSKPIARDVLYAFAQNSSPHTALAFRPLLFDAPEDIRFLVAKKLSRIRAPATVDTLIELLKREEKKGEKPSPLAWIAIEGLTAITRQGFGPSVPNWEGWWGANRRNPLPTGSDDGESGGTGTAVDFLKLSPDKARREAFVGVEQAPVKAVVVLSARFEKKVKRDLNNDHMEQMLERMNIPHTVVTREDFLKYDLSQTGAILINCAQMHKFCICPTCKPSAGPKINRLVKCTDCNRHEDFSGKLTEPQVKKLVTFVQGGGFLFCEDWTVMEVIERGFPKYVTAGAKLKEAVVDVMPVRGMGTHPYLKGIFEPAVIDAPAVQLGEPEPGEDEAEERVGGTTVVVRRKAPEPGGDVGEESMKIK
ncbi:MAG TPA: HEAT repeat domain-containing protein, partial [Planctomycetota bacterium]|nr:HEAT repeat domain-containing protein [Planctomycetota bacterium]